MPMTTDELKKLVEEHDASWDSDEGYIGSGEITDLESRAPDLAREVIALREAAGGAAKLLDECAQWMSYREKQIPGLPPLHKEARTVLATLRAVLRESE
jgi:hypothetical protein